MNEKWKKILWEVQNFTHFIKNALGCGGGWDGSHWVRVQQARAAFKNGNFIKQGQRGKANVAVKLWQEAVQGISEQREEQLRVEVSKEYLQKNVGAKNIFKKILERRISSKTPLKSKHDEQSEGWMWGKELPLSGLQRLLFC